MLGKIIDDMNSMKAGKGSKLFQLNIYSGVSFYVYMFYKAR